MKIFRAYLKPYRWLVLLSLVLAGIAQTLTLLDPVIFGKIIDDYVLDPGDKSGKELVDGVLFWLVIAVVLMAVFNSFSTPGAATSEW